MKNTKTYEELIEFSNVATAVLQGNKEKPSKADEKLKHALNKVNKKVAKKLKGYNETIAEHRIDLCEVDKDNAVIVGDNGEYKFSRENTKELMQLIKAEKQVEVEIIPHYVDIPKDFPVLLIEALEGFVFHPSAEDLEVEAEEIKDEKTE